MSMKKNQQGIRSTNRSTEINRSTFTSPPDDMHRSAEQQYRFRQPLFFLTKSTVEN